MSEKKYELTNETINFYGRVLHRIKALKDFDNVKSGDLGGWIEKESNLSHEGNCWIYDNAMVFGNAVAFDDALVYGTAKVFNNARVCGNACVYHNAKVYGDVEVCDNARVHGHADISNDAIISSKDDYIFITGLGSYNRNTTFFKCKDNIIRVNCGCFNGTLDEFIKEVNITHKDNDKYRKEYLSIINTVKIHFNI